LGLIFQLKELSVLISFLMTILIARPRDFGLDRLSHDLFDPKKKPSKIGGP